MIRECARIALILERRGNDKAHLLLVFRVIKRLWIRNFACIVSFFFFRRNLISRDYFHASIIFQRREDLFPLSIECISYFVIKVDLDGSFRNCSLLSELDSASRNF